MLFVIEFNKSKENLDIEILFFITIKVFYFFSVNYLKKLKKFRV